DLMLCVGQAHVGPLPRSWWAVAMPDGTLREGRRGVELAPGRVMVRGVIDLALDENGGVEVSSPTARGRSIWTRKQGAVAARGVVLGRRSEARAVVAECAGHHERHTSCRWPAGGGTAEHGAP